MSLRVEGHSRGRSKSPGRGAERSRSRDARAPAPSVQVIVKSEKSKGDEKKKSHKGKSSSHDSHSHSRHKKSSKHRYESESESESDSSETGSSSSESDSRNRKHTSRRHYSDSDSDRKPRSKKKSSSKKYYSESSLESSSSEDDHHHSRHRSSKKDHHKSSRSSKHDDHHRHESKADKVLIMPGGFAAPQYVIPTDSRGHVSGGHRLSISGGGLMAPGGHHGKIVGALPPGSPLLEAYRGTYQSISPMPSPLMLASKHDSDVSDMSSLEGNSDSDREHGHISLKKKVTFYDPERDAKQLAAALKHSTPDMKPVFRVLPHLSHDHIMMLRNEYKKHMKSNGKGVNIAKHIKLKFTGNFGKAAYAVALGQWEGEAHWANFWYQSDSSRRELLIECLMGRSNSEIVRIKDAFSDQRYNNSLEQCMQTELKKDKFRHAVLLVLEERRMSESDKVDMKLVRHDVEHLYKALTSKEGGETAMIEIIVVRSNKHLVEVLKLYEASYKKNFAREMIRRSQNLVGETLAHILNGVLNRAVRDALLLHQALKETGKDRAELLISRLVRFHWEPRHLAKIKIAYRHKYSNRLEEDIRDGVKGDFGGFMIQLCKADE